MVTILTVYVSLVGNDAWSGSLAAPTAAGTDGPFRTLQRAQQALRGRRPAPAAAPAPAEVLIRDGTHRLEQPLELGPEDSGVTYAAYPGESPVLSGGRRIEGWRRETVNGRVAWAAAVPAGWTFQELFVNGARRLRPRLPKVGFYRIAALPGVTSESPWHTGGDRFVFSPGDIRADWRNQGDVEVVVLHFWVDSHLPISAVDPAENLVTFSRESIFRMSDDFKHTGARYYVDNVFEALTEPGEWYLDGAADTLYYLPLPGEEPETAAVVAPVLTQLLRLQGDGDAAAPTEAPDPAGVDAAKAQANADPAAPARPISGVSFCGLTFAHAHWRLPPGGKGGTAQAASNVPAAVHLEHARDCVLRDCTITHCGTYALEVAAGCRDTLVQHCRLVDLGAGGIKIAKGSAHTRVVSNEIAECGRTFHAGVGVLIFDCGHNEVVDNHIHDLYYTGVSVGWVWGYASSEGHANRIERNHIHNIGQGLLNDMGGIYTLGVSPGTVLRGNLIHDIRSDGYGGWGIYLDEGSTGILVENNLVYRTKTGGFHQHYGRDNVIRNNVFAFASEGQIQRTRIEAHSSFRFERNIVYFDRGPLLHGAWKEPAAHFERNLYFDASRRPLDCGGRTWAQWRALGTDARSVVADPKFGNAAGEDFTLDVNSPAWALGFLPFGAGQSS